MDIPKLVPQLPLYSTIEIRWFFSSPIEELLNFVKELSLYKNKPETRTDTYFPIADRPDLGLKVRGDNYEVKQRQEWTIPLPESQPLPGKFEAWNKWTLEKLPKTESKLTGLPIIKKRWLTSLDKHLMLFSISQTLRRKFKSNLPKSKLKLQTIILLPWKFQASLPRKSFLKSQEKYRSIRG